MINRGVYIGKAAMYIRILQILNKERIYGKNQVVESINENSTKVSADIQNKENIWVFVLGFGKNIDVLEPQWLKDDLLEIADELKQKYGA